MSYLLRLTIAPAAPVREGGNGARAAVQAAKPYDTPDVGSPRARRSLRHRGEQLNQRALDRRLPRGRRDRSPQLRLGGVLRQHPEQPHTRRKEETAVRNSRNVHIQAPPAT